MKFTKEESCNQGAGIGREQMRQEATMGIIKKKEGGKSRQKVYLERGRRRKFKKKTKKIVSNLR